jgi:hypothetical protein
LNIYRLTRPTSRLLKNAGRNSKLSDVQKLHARVMYWTKPLPRLSP